MASLIRASDALPGRASCYASSCLYLKNEIQASVAWRVEILNEIVAAEIATLPADMQARFLRFGDIIGQVGFEGLASGCCQTSRRQALGASHDGARRHRASYLSRRHRPPRHCGAGVRQEDAEDAAA